VGASWERPPSDDSSEEGAGETRQRSAQVRSRKEVENKQDNVDLD